MKRIKQNITKKHFDRLMSHLKADLDIREARRERLIKLFSLLYYTGIRINESTQLTNKMMTKFLEEKKLIIKAHKQDEEKYIYLTKNSRKMLKKYFKDIEDNDNLIFVSERANKKAPMEISSVIRDANSYLRRVFTDEYITSHSFRQSLITDLAKSNVNTKVIQQLVHHKSISSTYRYMKFDEKDLTASLENIR